MAKLYYKTPLSFTLGGVHFEVSHKETLKSKNKDSEGQEWEILGTCSAPLGTVEIASTFQGNEVPKDSKTSTFYHELVHCILYSMGEYELDTKEQFVQSFAVLLSEFIRTAEFDISIESLKDVFKQKKMPLEDWKGILPIGPDAITNKLLKSENKEDKE